MTQRDPPGTRISPRSSIQDYPIILYSYPKDLQSTATGMNNLPVTRVARANVPQQGEHIPLAAMSNSWKGAGASLVINHLRL